MSTSKKNGAAASGSDTELSKDQKLAASEAEITRLQTALNAKPSSPELLLEDPDADAPILDGGGGYGAPNADARTLGGGGGYGGGAWDVDSSRAASQQGMLAPPPFRPPGTFGIPDPDSATKGISTQWQRYIDNNPTKAKTVFGQGEKTKLARLQRLGRRIQATLQGNETLPNNLDPDNVAVDGLVEIEDELQKGLQDVKAGADHYVLLWKHPERYQAIEAYRSHFELEEQAGPACMLQTNIDLEYQIALADLKGLKKDVKQGGPRNVRGSNTPQRSSRGNDSTQAKARRDRGGANSGGGGGGSAAATNSPANPQRSGRAGGPAATVAGATPP